jgi:hypothetical protein
VLRTVLVTTLALAWAAVAASHAGLVPGQAEPDDAETQRDISQTIWFQGYATDSSTGYPIDATYDVIVEMFDSDVDGTSVWGPETHSSVQITAGWFSVELGASVDLPTFPTPPYYLEITLNGEVMTPRQKLGSVPSAFRSARSDDSDDDWVIQGPNIYRMGYTGIGTFVPARDLDVAGTVRMESFEMAPGAVEGHVLTADSTGMGTWQAPSGGGADSDWVFEGDDLYANTLGDVAIGLGTSGRQLDAKLHVLESEPDPTAIKGVAAWGGAASTGVHGLAAGSTCKGIFGEAVADTGTTSYGVFGDAQAPGGGSATGVYANASVGNAGGAATGVSGSATAYTAGSAAYGIYGYASDTEGEAWGVYGTSFDRGVEGYNLVSFTSGALGTDEAGVWGSAGPGGLGLAGSFSGRVYVGESLGVGTSLPQSEVHVSYEKPGDTVGMKITNWSHEFGSNAALVFEEWDGETAEITMRGSTPTFGPRLTIYDNRTAAHMSIGLDDGEYVRLENGHVGIGPWSPISGPSTKLHVRGAGSAYGGVAGWQEVVAAFEESGGYHSAISINSDIDEDAILYLAEGGFAYWGLRHDSSDSHKLSLRYLDGGVSWITPVTIDSTGKVGIGTTDPDYDLDVAGDIQCVALHQTSDAALKANVRPLKHPLETLRKIPAVAFEWREEARAAGATPGARAIGVLAQDVESVLPEAVSSRPGSHKSVNYAELTALLIGALQELTERNEALEARVAELESSGD